MGKKKPITKPLLGSSPEQNSSLNDDAMAEIDRLVGNDYLASDDEEAAIDKIGAAGCIDMSIQRYTDSPMTTPIGTPLDTTSYVPQKDSPTSSSLPAGDSDEDLEEGTLSLEDLQTQHPVPDDHRAPGWSDTIDLISKDYYGLVHNYIAVGALYASSSGLLYPVFKVVLGLQSYQLKGAQSVLTIWWSFKVFFGCLSDCIPIFGYRRKYYVIMGWLLALLGTLGTMMLGQPLSGDAAWPWIVCLSAVNLFYIVADVAMDGMVTDLAKYESDEKRGRLQSTIYMIRSMSMSVAALTMAFGLNAPRYGGEFSFSLALPEYLGILAAVNALGLPFYFSLADRGGYARKSYWKQIYRMYERMKLSGVHRVVLFSFFVHVFAYVSNATVYDIEHEWLRVEPIVDGIFNNVLSALVTAFAIWFTKAYLLNVSWRKTLIVCIVAMAAFVYVPNVLIDLGVIRSQYFFGASILAQQSLLGVFFIVSSLAAVEVSEPGNAATTYGLLTTVGNLTLPFTSLISSNLASAFDLYDAAGILKDDAGARQQMVLLDTTIMLIQLCAIAPVFILPTQKLELRQLIESGKRSIALANVVTVGLVLCMGWSLVGSLMQIFPSTSCLKIVGGAGC